MQQHIRVTVTVKALRVWNRDAAKNQRTPFDQTVGVITDAGTDFREHRLLRVFKHHAGQS